MENEIDAKLVSFSKLGLNAGSSHSSADEVPLLDEEHVFENMTSEIESLLAKVNNIFHFTLQNLQVKKQNLKNN